MTKKTDDKNKTTLKVDYISDLHMGFVLSGNRSYTRKVLKRIKEFVEATLPDELGDVLVVAGDIDEYNTVSLMTLEEYAKHYEKVYFVFGNHDLYILTGNQKKKLKDSYNRQAELKSLVERSPYSERIKVLDNEQETYKGVKFAGTTSWYRLTGDKDVAWWGLYSNDSRYIYPRGEYSSQERHERDMEFYESLEHEDVDVLVTHVPPVHLNKDREPLACYHNEAVANSGLYAKHWVCGHQHVRAVSNVHGTMVYVNANGYPDEFGRVTKVQSFYT